MLVIPRWAEFCLVLRCCSVELLLRCDMEVCFLSFRRVFSYVSLVLGVQRLIVILSFQKVIDIFAVSFAVQVIQ